MSSFSWSFLPSVSRSHSGVKYMKHVVRNEGDACFSFSTSVVSFQVRVYPATALCCGACHVNVKPKFTEEKSSLKLRTLVERRGKHSTTDQDICIKSTFSRIRKDEVEPFVPWHWLSMKISLYPGDVSAPRRMKINSSTYFACLFL